MYLDSQILLAGITGHMGLCLHSTMPQMQTLLHDQNHNLSRPQKEYNVEERRWNIVTKSGRKLSAHA